MKKLTLSFAILTFVFLFFSSFSEPNPPKKVKTKAAKQSGYIWIIWGCRPSGSTFQIFTGPNGQNCFQTATSTPNPNVCPPEFGSSGYCAIRFLLTETEAIPGYNGYRRPKTGVDPWAAGRLYVMCQ